MLQELLTKFINSGPYFLIAAIVMLVSEIVAKTYVEGVTLQAIFNEHLKVLLDRNSLIAVIAALIAGLALALFMRYYKDDNETNNWWEAVRAAAERAAAEREAPRPPPGVTSMGIAAARSGRRSLKRRRHKN